MSPLIVYEVPGIVYFYCLCFLLKRPTYFSYAKSVDSDLTPHLAASDLGMHCSLVSLLLDTRNKCATRLTMKTKSSIVETEVFSKGLFLI